MTGRMYNETLGKLHFWLTFVALNLTFFPMHWVGLVGMPRRVADFSEEYANVNMFITISSFILGASFVIFFYNVITSWRQRPARRRQPVALDDARVAGLARRRRCSTSTRSRRSSAARTSTASPARSTPSSHSAPGRSRRSST